jgi:cytochrome c biogenesis protein CcmG/thiol:disulfide interchange protein DsbE
VVRRGIARNWIWPVGLLLIVALLVAGCSAASEASAKQGVSQGRYALDFTLEALDGNEASLSDYAGSVVLVNFWATWCPPCRDEIPHFEEASRMYRDEGLVVLGVNFQESAAEVEPFVERLGVTYPILLDESGRVAKEYRAVGLPTSVLVDRDGVIQVRHSGYLSEGQLERYLSKLLPAQ